MPQANLAADGKRKARVITLWVTPRFAPDKGELAQVQRGKERVEPRGARAIESPLQAVDGLANHETGVGICPAFTSLGGSETSLPIQGTSGASGLALGSAA